MSARDRLPQLDGGLFLTDGGLETTLIFKRGIDLPLFAAFTLLADEDGRRALRSLLRALPGGGGRARRRLRARHADLAGEPALGRRARDTRSTSSSALNRSSVELIEELRDEHGPRIAGPIVLTGVIGPQDDGYQPHQLLGADEAQEYHATQIATFADTAAEMVSAMTLTYVEEAIGIARAAQAAGIPAAISFTVETDGRLPSGQALAEAIEQVESETAGGPAYYMVNCAHPTHFERRARAARAVGRADPRRASERLDHEPRRARPGDRARRRRSGRPRRPLRRARRQAART